MAGSDRLRDMYDVAFKPRLLRSLVREHLPDEKRPFNEGPFELANVVLMVKTHRLLMESDSSDPKLLESWKAAVDAWVNRVLVLISSNMPDKARAGIFLLGLTCQECNSERFLTSYPEWLQKLHLHIQPPADSQLVKVASCALSDIFSRLGRLPRVRKDANAQAGKLIQPVLKLLSEDSSEAVWEGTICLLCTLITFFPSSIHRSYDSVEAAVVSKLMFGKCSAKISKELGHCLALLPKSRGDEESWSTMMHKILYTICVHLNDAFQGVEEESKRGDALRLLVPPGKDPPPPLGGCTKANASDQRTKNPERLHISSISALMHCCYMMLTNSYPVQVRVPIRSLVALVGRVLMVDGNVSQSLSLFTTSMQQESICSELPLLHSYCLELLKAVTIGMHSQLLPHAPEIAQILTEYFKRCLLSELRIKVYAIIRILLMSMGFGISFYLAQEVVKNAFVDLDFNVHMGVGPSLAADAKVSNEPLQPQQKKRKHGKTASSLVEQPNKVDQEVRPPKNSTSLPLKIAALEVLETVLTVGGSLGADSWRPSVDRLLVTVATNVCKKGWAREESYVAMSIEPVSTLADLQLAALKALLASLLSPARFRPPHLAQGLDLFRRGMRETGTKLADFCGHALLALEVLIHPRALPLINHSFLSTNSFDEVDNRFHDIYSFGDKQNTPFSNSSLGRGSQDPNLVEDDLYKSWLAENDDTEVQVIQVRKNDKNQSVIAAEKITVPPSPEKFHPVSDSSNTRMPKKTHDEVAVVSNRENIEGKKDENMVEAQQLQEQPIETNTSNQSFNRVISENVQRDPADGEMDTNNVDTETKGSEIVGSGSPVSNDWSSAMERNLNFQIEVDSDMEPLPDIIDADSDSD